MGELVKRCLGLCGAIRAVLLTLLTMFIAWFGMVILTLVLYADGHWILLPIGLGMMELIAAPFVTALVLALWFAKVNTASSIVVVHALLVLVFVLLGAGVLPKYNYPGTFSWLPIVVHAFLLCCIAWVGGANTTSTRNGV